VWWWHIANCYLTIIAFNLHLLFFSWTDFYTPKKHTRIPLIRQQQCRDVATALDRNASQEELLIDSSIKCIQKLSVFYVWASGIHTCSTALIA
jgi:hypothetical protein